MTAFNYKNAYRLATQTNRELHMNLDTYKSMYDEAQKEIKRKDAEIARLRQEINELRIAQIETNS